MLRTFLGIIVCTFSCGLQAAGDWPRFRGPNGTGVVEEVSFPASWTDKDYAWQSHLTGKGHSSPVVWQNRLYVTSASAATGDVTLHALDTESGRQMWDIRYDLEPYQVHVTNTLASCTPAVDDRHVYLPLVSPEAIAVVAVNHDGEEIWRRRFGAYDANHGCGISPIVFEAKVILACDHHGESFLIALDASTGETIWRIPRTSCKASYATPAVWESPAGDKQLIFHSSSEGMVGVSPEGKVLWQLKELFPERCVSSPLVADGLVFGGSGGGSNGISLVSVRPASKGSEAAELVYELRKSVPQVPTPVAWRDMLFILHDRGTVSCRNLTTGAEFWTERIGGQYYSSPICVGGRLYCTAQDGAVVVLAAEKEFTELGRSQLPGGSHATPAVTAGRMFFRTESAVVCLLAQ